SARRGWYSGALGYVTPDGECDFNVVIRSLLYHPKQERWKGWAGSALTVYAQPEAEWQELQLKMHAPMAAWKEAVAESTREGQPAKQDADVLMNGSNPEKA
ncbi:MAG: hypothetical protein RL168_79, partial [Bacteroidota bacterium]